MMTIIINLKMGKPSDKKPWLIFLLTSFFFFNWANAQTDELQVTVHIKVTEMGIKTEDRKSDPVFKFFIGNENSPLLNHGGECYTFRAKDQSNTLFIPDQRFPNIVQDLQSFKVPILSKSSFDFVMECYADNKGEKCILDKKDELHTITKKNIDLNTISPGDYSDTILIEDMQPLDNQNHFYCKIIVKYNIISPDAIKPNGATHSIYAADKLLVLNSGYQLNNRDHLVFTWESSVDNTNSWTRLPMDKQKPLLLNINPLENLFGGKIETTRNVTFRLRVNSKDTFAISEMFATSFTPASPVISNDDVTVLQTCRGYADGSVTVSKIKAAVPGVSYVLRKAAFDKQPCNLTDATASSCLGFLKAGNAENGAIEIKGLAADKYNLLVYNSGLEVGNVYSTTVFTVTAFDDLNLSNPNFSNPNCINTSGGELSIVANGGSTDKSQWSVVLKPSAGQMVWKNQQNPIKFTGLEQGNYTIEITDGCANLQTKDFVLKQPEKLQIEKMLLIKSQTEAKGDLIIKMKNGSGKYRLELSDADEAKRVKDSSNFIIPLRIKGTYRIIITDYADPQCLVVDTNFTYAKQIPQPYQVNTTALHTVKSLSNNSSTDAQLLVTFGKLLPLRKYLFANKLTQNIIG
jgi:hypothetical protein